LSTLGVRRIDFGAGTGVSRAPVADIALEGLCKLGVNGTRFCGGKIAEVDILVSVPKVDFDIDEIVRGGNIGVSD